jgi:hypothetical protein
MKTAVEWLHEKLATSQLEDMQKNINLWFKEAKEMEKQQIIDAVYYTCSSMTHYDLPCGKQYYNETFKK